MKTGLLWLSEYLKKHFFFFVFSIIFAFHLCFAFLVRDYFFGSETGKNIILNLIIISIIIYIILIALLILNRIQKLILKNKKRLMFPVKLSFFISLAAFLFKYLGTVYRILIHFSENVSCFWENLSNDFNFKRTLNPELLVFIVTAFSLLFFVMVFWRSDFKIVSINIVFSEIEIPDTKANPQKKLSLGFLYKAFP